MNKDDQLIKKMNAFQLPVYYYDRDIFLFAAQLLDLIMFLVCVEEASQMQVKMLRTNQSQKLNKYKIKSQLLQRKISAFIITCCKSPIGDF